MNKKVICFLLAAIMFIGIVPLAAPDASAAAMYNPNAALTYAAAHWGDSQGLCAEFVSNCLAAGGIIVFDRSTKSLYNKMVSREYGTSYKLVTTYDDPWMKVKYEDNKDILSLGDPIFFYCPKCDEYPHTVLFGGVDNNGFITIYSHNNARNNTTMYAALSSDHVDCLVADMEIYTVHLDGESYLGESELALSGALYPSGYYATMPSFNLGGYVTSDYLITSVTGAIYSEDKLVMAQSEVPVTYSYSLGGQINFSLKFGSLPDGKYTYKVTAGDTSGNYQELLTSDFTIGVGNTEEPIGPTMENFQRDKAVYTVGTFSDVNEQFWYGVEDQGVLKCVIELGIMAGNGDGTFGPEDPLKLSEVTKMAAIVHNTYGGGQYIFDQDEGQYWYSTYVDYAYASGLLDGLDLSDMEMYATREQMAYIFAKTLPQTEFTQINDVLSLPDVSEDSTYGSEIFMLYRAGVLTGNTESGTFYPDSTIIRAEAAAIVSRVAIVSQRMKLDF